MPEAPTLAQRVEAMLFASQTPMRITDLRHAVDPEGSGEPQLAEIQPLRRQLEHDAAARDSGIEQQRRGTSPRSNR